MDHAVGRGHDVHLVTTDWPTDRAAGVGIHVIPYRRLTRSSRIKSFSSATSRFLQSNKYDVVVSLDRTECQDLWHAGEGVHPVWLQRRRCFESRWHAWWNERSPGQRAILDLERRCFRNTAVIVAPSRLVAQDIRRTYDATDKEIHTVYYGIDLRRFTVAGREEDRKSVRREIGLPMDATIFLFVGHGFHRKGLRETLLAFRGIKDGVLVVIGRDNAASWQTQAARLGIANRVVFLSPRDDVARFYRAANVMVLPSWFESFGLVGGESLACGTPLVTTPFAGVAELVRDGSNGKIVSTPAAVHELTAAIVEVAAWPGSEAKSAEIAESVRWCSMETELERLFAIVEAVGRRNRECHARP
jgi:UDP-glucose:(heptosyl)LPS alpha-1,3-glucosyltransferase